MTDPTESTQQLKARIQRQLLAQIEKIATANAVAAPTAEGVGLLINAVHAYDLFMSAPTVTFDPDGVAQ